MDAEIIRVLQKGWWESVALVKVAGDLRVRKTLHRPEALWARDVFIKEYHYLRTLPAGLVPPFIRLLDQCAELSIDPPPMDRPLWFDMEYAEGFTEVRALLAEDCLTATEAECIQNLLIEALFNGLYRLPGEPFDTDAVIWQVLEQVLDYALQDEDFAPFAQADGLLINGRLRPNLRDTMFAARQDQAVRRQLEEAPAVRLHGDLFYENVLYRPDPPAIRLIDPVSVAGVSGGPMVFDRAKFASWISGELYAMRHQAFQLRANPGDDPPRVDYRFAETDPVIRGLGRLDLGSRLIAVMDRHIGPAQEAQAVLHAYFNLVMAANVLMPQKLLRYVRAVEILARWS